jgi:hypothetical protein
LPRVGPVAQRLEQGTHNSRKSFCARISPACAVLLTLGDSAFRIRVALQRIARFCSKNFADRSIDREGEFLRANVKIS